MDGDPRALALAVLRGERRIPRTKPGRIELALELPRLAEELRCAPDVARHRFLAERLRALSQELEPDELGNPAFGTAHLAVGCQEAAALVGVELDLPVKWDDWSFRRESASLLRPRVYVPLMNAEPARVFHSCRPGEDSFEDEALHKVRALVKRLLGVESPRWALEHVAPGRSKMAALFVRAILELWPEKTRVLAHGYSPGNKYERTAFGISGELDDAGRVLQVDGIEDKVQRFFQRFPDGRLFVPASQWRRAREVADALDSEELPEASLRSKRQWRIQPLHSMSALLVRLGISTETCPDTLPFEKLRSATQQVTFLNGESCGVLETVSPRYTRARPLEEDDDPDSLRDHLLVEEFHEAWLSGRARLAYIEGGPGSGKSVALQRLAGWLHSEHVPLGPALYVSARDWVQSKLDMAEALPLAWPSLSLEHCRGIVELARSPALSPTVWLLVDGLDEVRLEDRRRIRKILHEWPGPVVVGARPLPDEEPGPYHLRLGPLEPSEQKKLFQLLKKPQHWELLTEGRKEGQLSPDRRKEMLTDLCSTPLGLALLAQLKEEELGPSLNVQQVLRRGMRALLERAQKMHRISEDTLTDVLGEGFPLLGAAAWAMLQRGGATLEPDDLTHMQGDRELLRAVHQVLNSSDLVQRVGPEAYRFSHKSFAEYCAARFLRSRGNAESELPRALGDPSVEAVAFHFGAELPPERFGSFLQALASNPHRPLSSLALATRLLAATRPQGTQPEAVMEVLCRRLRLASRRATSHHRFPRLPGELQEDLELWTALGRWAEEVRPRVETLLDACAPSVARFLRGELPPLPPTNSAGAGEVEEDPRVACDFAEKLASRLGLQLSLPPRVLARFRHGIELLEARVPSMRVEELEDLFVEPDDAERMSPATVAATVWARRASPERKLKRLDVLSKFPIEAVKPVLEAVISRGTLEQRREAIIRAELTRLQAGGDQRLRPATQRRIRRYARMSREQLLRRWKLLWERGVLGHRGAWLSDPLDGLYATFLADEHGPARWRALVALRLVYEAQYVPHLRDPFPAVRTTALRRIRELRHEWGRSTEHIPIEESLRSEEDCERWVAFTLLDDQKVPLEELLAALRARTPLPERPVEMPPWKDALHEAGRLARRRLFLRALKDARDRKDLWLTLFALAESRLEEVLESKDAASPEFIQAMLDRGTTPQRRIAAKLLERGDPSKLVAHEHDRDPEISKRARAIISHLQYKEDSEQRNRQMAERERQATLEQQALEARPVLTREQTAAYGSFEELWKALPGHKLPFIYADPPLRLLKRRNRNLTPPEEPEVELTTRDLYRHHHVTQRLLQLYKPEHRLLLVDGLGDSDLRLFAMPVLREHLPVPELEPLLRQSGQASFSASHILEGTPQGREAARRLCAELLEGRFDKEFEGSELHNDMRRSRTWEPLWSPPRRLLQLDGLRAVLPLMEHGVPAWLRSEALTVLRKKWEKISRTASEQPEVLRWARERENAEDADVRRIAWDTLAAAGTSEDAVRWRERLFQSEAPEPRLVAAIRIVSRDLTAPDQNRLRALVTHSAQVGSEAVQTLARTANTVGVEELVQWLELPPASLEALSNSVPGWARAIGKAVIRFGEATQVKRAARQLRHDDSLAEAALQNLRFPEHLLFLASRWKPPEPSESRTPRQDEGTLKRLREAIERLDRKAAHRVLMEAAFWELPWASTAEHPFRHCAGALVEYVDERDVDLLADALRKTPDDPLALRWLSAVRAGEETVATVWTEKGFPWWVPQAT